MNECEHHSGIIAKQDSLEKKCKMNCNAIETVNKKVDNAVKMETFKWVLGTIIFIIISILANQFSGLSRIDKNVAVINEQIKHCNEAFDNKK